MTTDVNPPVDIDVNPPVDTDVNNFDVLDSANLDLSNQIITTISEQNTILDLQYQLNLFILFTILFFFLYIFFRDVCKLIFSIFDF